MEEGIKRFILKDKNSDSIMTLVIECIQPEVGKKYCNITLLSNGISSESIKININPKADIDYEEYINLFLKQSVTLKEKENIKVIGTLNKQQ